MTAIHRSGSIAAAGLRGGRFFPVATLLLTLLLAACKPGGSESPLPTAPDLTPFILAGFVTELDNGSPIAIPGALVEVTSGPHSGKSTTADSLGRYSIGGLSGELNVRASREGFVPTGRILNITADTTLNFVLDRDTPTPGPPPEPTFTLSGIVMRAQGAPGPIAGATVEVKSGAREGDTATTDGTGHYSIPGLSRDIVVRASRDGFLADEEEVDIAADMTLDFSLMDAPELTMCLDLDDEEVHITNNGTEEVVLTDWILRDDEAQDEAAPGGNGNEFIFVQDLECRESMDGFTLPAGMTVIITSGDAPEHDPPARIIGFCTPVWNDDGDNARLFNHLDELVIEAAGRLGAC